MHVIQEKVIPKIEPLDIKPFVNPPIIKSDRKILIIFY